MNSNMMDAHTSAMRFNPITIRIVAMQLLFFGLLFLPHVSIYPLKLEVAELSIVMQAFQGFVDNPAYYGLLMLVTVMILFSLDTRVDAMIIRNGRISMGHMLLKPLGRILLIYVGLFFLSWLFLIYKLMFMGDVYINHFIF